MPSGVAVVSADVPARGIGGRTHLVGLGGRRAVGVQPDVGEVRPQPAAHLRLHLFKGAGRDAGRKPVRLPLGRRDLPLKRLGAHLHLTRQVGQPALAGAQHGRHRAVWELRADRRRRFRRAVPRRRRRTLLLDVLTHRYASL